MATTVGPKVGGVGAALDRYRPVALAVCAIAVATWIFPGAERDAPSVATSVPRLPGSSTGADEPAPDEPTAAPDALPSASAAPLPALAPRSPAVVAPPASTSSGTDAQPATATPSRPTPALAPTPAPLTVTRSAWATRTAGTPIADSGVPAGSLPIGTRFGQTDKASYVALAGTASTLTFVEDTEGARAADTAVVQACLITTSDWSTGEAKSFDEAPPHDPERCVAGTRRAEGTWTFDLSTFPDRGGDAGFALVPGPDAPIDFQVALR